MLLSYVSHNLKSGSAGPYTFSVRIRQNGIVRLCRQEAFLQSLIDLGTVRLSLGIIRSRKYDVIPLDKILLSKTSLIVLPGIQI